MDTRRVISNGTKTMAEKTHPYTNTVWHPISLDSAFEISQLQKNCLSLTQPFVLSDLLTFFTRIVSCGWIMVFGFLFYPNAFVQIEFGKKSRSRWLVSHLLSWHVTVVTKIRGVKFLKILDLFIDKNRCGFQLSNYARIKRKADYKVTTKN